MDTTNDVASVMRLLSTAWLIFGFYPVHQCRKIKSRKWKWICTIPIAILFYKSFFVYWVGYFLIKVVAKAGTNIDNYMAEQPNERDSDNP